MIFFPPLVQKKNTMSLQLRKGYTLHERLGRGSFGEVYSCKNKQGETLAAKLEERRNKKGRARGGPSQLHYEHRIYRLLAGSSGIPRVYDYFSDGDYNIMIMDKLGKSVEDVLVEQGGSLAADIVVAIGRKVLSALEHVHRNGVAHRDLKPQNMMLAQDTSNTTVYLIDYGLAKRFNDPMTGHIPYSQNKRGLTGTPRYASVSSHLGAEQSRRDDLESLVYIMVYLRTGRLPWQGMRGSTKKTKYQKIMRMKQNISDRRLAAQFPPAFKEFVQIVRSLDFEQEPPYAQLQSILLRVAEEAICEQKTRE